MFLPPIIAQVHFPMQVIAGFSILNVFFSTLSGSFYYIRERLVHFNIALYLGVPGFFGGMLGVFTAQFTSENALRIIFAIIAIISAILMHIPSKEHQNDETFLFTPIVVVLTIIGGFSIGALGGLIGLGAAFIIIPVMVYLFKFPIKKAIGSSFVTCLFISFGSFITKISLGNLPLNLGLSLIAGGIIGVQIGGRVSKFLPSTVLKRMAALAILLISIKVFFDLF